MKYTKEIVSKIKQLYEDGYRITDICHKVGISYECFYNWKNSKVEFSDILKESQPKRDNTLNIQLEHTAYKSAIGYEIE